MTSHVEFYERVLELLKGGEPFVITHLIHHAGATPNDPGSRMIVKGDGSIEFTIGGGPFEAQVIQDALHVLRQRKSEVRTYDITYEELGMRCGGRAQVYFELILPLEPLWVFGAGHVGSQLTRFALETGFFSPVLIDDRDAFIQRWKNNPRVNVIKTDSSYSSGYELPPDGAYVVVVTRCHDVDERVIERVLRKETYRYVGMIGSRTKVRQLWKILENKGISSEKLRAIDAPIGVQIGGKSPVDIAISILARLLQVRNGAYPTFSEQVKKKSS